LRHGQLGSVDVFLSWKKKGKKKEKWKMEKGREVFTGVGGWGRPESKM